MSLQLSWHQRVSQVPLTIQDWIIANQVDQGNLIDYDANISSTKIQGNFDFHTSHEGSDFWFRLTIDIGIQLKLERDKIIKNEKF